MIDEIRICENCLAQNELKDEVLERGYGIRKCKICHSRNVKALPANDILVKRIFRALVRLKYSEWDYNHHLGGDSLQSLIFNEQLIFNLDKNASELDFEDAFLTLEEKEWYPKNPEHISLGGNYSEGWVLNSIGKNINYDLLDIVRGTFNSNYYDLEGKVAEQIEKLRSKITAEHVIGTKFYRARLGVESRLKSSSLFKKEIKYIPHTGTKIGAPPIEHATEGRLNRQRVSILYLASDTETAIAELRPHPGHLISLGQFRAKKPIKYANLAKHDIREFLSDDLLDSLNHILSVSKVLNLPVQPENKSLYMATQLFADGIRKAGFEGVSFKSSLGHGMNFTSFYPEHFEYIPNSGIVHKIKSLSYKSLPLNTFQTEESKDDFEEENDFISTIFDEFEY